MQYFFISTLLIIAAICFLNVDIFKWIKKLVSEDGFRGWLERFLEQRKEGKTHNLKERIDKIQGRQRVNFLSQNFEQARHILITTNQESKTNLLKLICVVFFFIGAIISLFIQNILLLPVLGVGFALIPMWYIKYNEYHYITRQASELEVALSVITTSYMRCENLIQSVDENLHYIERPVKDAFAKFLNEVKYVNANVQQAIEGMKGTFSNGIFHEWCDTMLLCQSDPELKNSLLPIVDQFRDTKDLQEQMKTLMLQPTRDYCKIVIIVFAIFPLFYLINREWFNIMVYTFGGKALITLLSVVILYGMNKAINISRPVN